MNLTTPGHAASALGYDRLDALLPDLGASEFPWVFTDGFETGNASKWSSTAP